MSSLRVPKVSIALCRPTRGPSWGPLTLEKTLSQQNWSIPVPLGALILYRGKVPREYYPMSPNCAHALIPLTTRILSKFVCLFCSALLSILFYFYSLIFSFCSILFLKLKEKKETFERETNKKKEAFRTGRIVGKVCCMKISQPM